MIFGWARNRWVVVPALLAGMIAAWNIHVAANANGVIEGRVVDSRGAPIAGAAVTLFNRSFITSEARQNVTTDAGGRFRITGNASHAVQLGAEAPGFAPGPRRTVRLLFRAQDVTLADPLVLVGR
jgi:hypothetical protein